MANCEFASVIIASYDKLQWWSTGKNANVLFCWPKAKDSFYKTFLPQSKLTYHMFNLFKILIAAGRFFVSFCVVFKMICSNIKKNSLWHFCICCILTFVYHQTTTLALTLLQYFAKVLVVACAVPPAVPELVLALPDAQPGPFGHLTDNLRLRLAQLGLLPSQTLRFSANAVGIHHQRTAHRPAKV